MANYKGNQVAASSWRISLFPWLLLTSISLGAAARTYRTDHRGASYEVIIPGAASFSGASASTHCQLVSLSTHRRFLRANESSK